MARTPSYLGNLRGYYFVRVIIPEAERYRFPNQKTGKNQTALVEFLGTRSKKEAERLKHPIVAKFLAMIRPPDPLRARLEADHNIPATWSPQQAAAALDLLRLGIEQDSAPEDIEITISVPVRLPGGGRPTKLPTVTITDADIDRHWQEQFAPDVDDRTDEERVEAAEAHEALKEASQLPTWPPLARPAPAEFVRRGPAFRAAAEEVGIDPDKAPTNPAQLRARIDVPPAPIVGLKIENDGEGPAKDVVWLVGQYLDEMQRPDGTRDDYIRSAEMFSQIVGPKLARDVDGEAVLEFKRVLASLPSLKTIPHEDRDRPLLEILAKYDQTDQPRVTEATINRRLAGLSAAYKWGAAHKIVPTNPFEGAKLSKRGHKGKPRKKRQPYSIDDLKTIFSSRIYTQNYRPGGSGGEAHYWLPLLALYSGCRLEEMGQADLADVMVVGSAYILRLAWGEDKSLKTETSIRLVPIHSDLVRIGFDRYVAHLKAAGETKLFPDLLRAGQKKFTDAYSKAWRRECKDLGLTDPAKVFHSFRHNYKQNSVRSKIHPDLARILLGHAAADAHQGYGGLDQDVSLLVEAAEQVVTRDLDLAHLRWELPPA